MSSTSSELGTIILRAGAGAGKTTTLTQTFLDFAKDFQSKNGKFPKIVVTTFTRKATQELKERLLSKALEMQRDDLFQYVGSKSQVQISTIHGVLSVFLARYGSVIGLTPDYKIMGTSEIRKVARKIIRKYILADEEIQELLEEYDFSTLESMLTSYFDARVEYGEMHFIQAQEMGQLCQKVIQNVGNKLKRVALEISQEATNEDWVTYAQALQSFSWDGSAEDWDQFFSRLNNFWENLKKPNFRKASPAFSMAVNEELEELRKELSKILKSTRFQKAYWDKHERNCALFERLAESFYADFMQSKLENGILSMSDLETLASKIAMEHPQAAEMFSNEWDFWMVDEYQDTSPIQVKLLDRLIGTKPVFIVGDPQQSIYLFRGARSEVFQEKVEQFKEAGHRVEVKLVNYRSNPDVLAFFNHYFTRTGKQFSEMEPAPGKETPEHNQPPIQILISSPDEEEAEKSSESLVTVARIQELLNEGVSPEEICVLGRTHRTLEEIAAVAQEHGVSVLLHSGSDFYNRREVLDVLAFVKFLLNPHDNINLVSLLRSPWAAIEDSQLIEFCQGGKSYWREIQKHEQFSQDPMIVNLQKLLVTAEASGLSFALKQAIINFGMLDYSQKIDPTGRREANLWKVLSLLSQEERRPGFNYLDFLDQNLENLSVDEAGGEADATPVIEPKRVNFMTVHASKGLQFSHVLLPGMGKDPRSSISPPLSIRETDGLWTLKVRDPETQSMVSSILAESINDEMKEREAQEFYRVLYVALTRAKTGVSLIWNSDIDKNSWAAASPLNLEEGLHEEADFSYLVRRDNALPQVFDSAPAVLKVPKEKFTTSSAETRLKSLSVTEIIESRTGVAAQGSSGKDLLAALSRAQQGTEAHRVFEALKYSELEKVIEGLDAHLVEAIHYLNTQSEIPIQKIISDGFTEWGFALKHKESLLQGQIDLWGVVDGTTWVVDYKTGSQRYLANAQEQLRIYAWALNQMKRVPDTTKLKLAVVYPLDRTVKVVDFVDFKKFADLLEENF